MRSGDRHDPSFMRDHVAFFSQISQTNGLVGLKSSEKGNVKKIGGEKTVLRQGSATSTRHASIQRGGR